MVKRYALVTGARDRQEVEAYLPDNYAVEGEAIQRTSEFTSTHPGRSTDKLVTVIGGEDKAGWTLDDYVIPRLASGVITAQEIDLSHPVMKAIEL